MRTIISHSNANRQWGISHPKTIALKYDASNLLPMTAKDRKDAIAERHRRALKYWKSEMDLSVDGWCKKAGITESTLRNFINGASNTMLGSTLEVLAGAIGLTVGQLLLEEPYTVDEELLRICSEAIETAAKALKVKLGVATATYLTFKMYKSIMEDRRHGQKTEPSVAMARLLLTRAS